MRATNRLIATLLSLALAAVLLLVAVEIALARVGSGGADGLAGAL